MHNDERAQMITRVSAVTIGSNLILSVLKLAGGFLSGSSALVSDGVDSASDILKTLIVLAGVHLGKRSKDENHQYGHEKMESMASIALAVLLIGTAVGIALSAAASIRSILSGAHREAPGHIALYIAGVSILSKELLFRYARTVARKTKSSALLADAWNFRSDAIASVGSVIGIGGALLGFPVLDPLASLFIAGLILRAAVKISIIGINEVTDHAAAIPVQEQIHGIITGTEGVVLVDEMKTRLHGSALYVDVEIAVDGSITLEKAHEIAHNVSEAVYGGVEDVKECMVHVNPCRKCEG